MMSQRTRAYRDVAADASVRLVPIFELDALTPGKWIVHSENGGYPFCVGVNLGVGDCDL